MLNEFRLIGVPYEVAAMEEQTKTDRRKDA